MTRGASLGIGLHLSKPILRAAVKGLKPRLHKLHQLILPLRQELHEVVQASGSASST